MGDGAVVLFLAGDVMTGRGVDQILPCRSEPGLRERSVTDARTYVELAELVNGPIPRPVDHAWPWGDALGLLDEMAPDLRVINLETSVTLSDDYLPGKGIHYRMHPGNVPCLTVARLDVCTLANNHVLDFGIRGLLESCDVLRQAGLQVAGAGRDEQQVWSPAVVGAEPGRVLIWSVAVESSGTPPSWAATADRAGVAFLPDTSEASAAVAVERVRQVRKPGDLVVVSVHWGSNWGYDISPADVGFAHQLIDAGVDVVYGHSSHHPRPIEVYRNKLVLYGCGDLINDYEGIGGYQEYRDDLRLLYFADLDRRTGELRTLRMVSMQARQMRLWRADPADARWLHSILNQISGGFGTHFDYESDGTLVVRRN